VSADVSRNIPVISLASGRIVEIDARLGDTVTKGQLLLKVQSQDIAQAFSDYRQAVADETLAKAQLDRSKELLEKGAIAKKDEEVAEDTEVKAKVTVETAMEHVRCWAPIWIIPVRLSRSRAGLGRDHRSAGDRGGGREDAGQFSESVHHLRSVEGVDHLRRVRERYVVRAAGRVRRHSSGGVSQPGSQSAHRQYFSHAGPQHPDREGASGSGQFRDCCASACS
jgi:pyruvate/2-oxoglutarate dehydrogenase complex dihydrolipoamide acyltransferase (E2) component